MFCAIFPGQGSQHLGMGKEFFENFKTAKLLFEEASESIKVDLKKLCFDGPESDLKLTINTQVVLLVTSVIAWRVFCEETDFRPNLAMGHSLGEYSALVAAEGLSFPEAVKLTRSRGMFMQTAVPVGEGSMMAMLGVSDELAPKACQTYQEMARQAGLADCVIEAANFNCPGQVVISGHTQALDYMKTNFNSEGFGGARVKFISLPVSAPFHSSLMAPAAERLKKELNNMPFKHSLTMEIIHNVNATPNKSGADLSKLLYEQVTKPVLWTQSVKLALQRSATVFVEFGAGRVLSGLIRKINAEARVYNVDGPKNMKEAISNLRENS